MRATVVGGQVCMRLGYWNEDVDAGDGRLDRACMVCSSAFAANIPKLFDIAQTKLEGRIQDLSRPSACLPSLTFSRACCPLGRRYYVDIGIPSRLSSWGAPAGTLRLHGHLLRAIENIRSAKRLCEESLGSSRDPPRHGLPSLAYAYHPRAPRILSCSPLKRPALWRACRTNPSTHPLFLRPSPRRSPSASSRPCRHPAPATQPDTAPRAPPASPSPCPS